MLLFRFEYTAITKFMLNRATLVTFYSNSSLLFAGTVNLALVRFTCSAQCFFCLIIFIEKSFQNAESSMIPVLRKIVQLNIKYRKNGGPIIHDCTGAQSSEVTALVKP